MPFETDFYFEAEAVEFNDIRREYGNVSAHQDAAPRLGCMSDENYEKAKSQTENYRKFKEWSLELVDLSIELAKLTDKEAGSQ